MLFKIVYSRHCLAQRCHKTRWNTCLEFGLEAEHVKIEDMTVLNTLRVEAWLGVKHFKSGGMARC